MKIVDVCDTNIEKVKIFLSTFIDEIDEDVLKNALILIDNDCVIGIISFERFCKIGLIRYFLFSKKIDEYNLIKLFQGLVQKARKNNITKFLSFVEDENNASLFKYLGFFQVDKKYVFIEEKNILNTDSKEALVYCYLIV